MTSPDLSAYALPDLTYDFAAADAVARAAKSARSTVATQAPSRAALVAAAQTDFAGHFADVFTANASVALQDCSELLTALDEVVRGIGLLSDAARSENTRRRTARAWRDRVLARRANMVDSTWDAVFGEEPPPSAGKIEAPEFEQAVPQSRHRDTPPPGNDSAAAGAVSSARPANLRSFASGSASLDEELSALPGRLERANADFLATCDFGRFDVSPVVRGLRAWLTANDADVRWAGAVAAAFEAAGSSGGTVSVADSAVAAALSAAHLSDTRTDVDFNGLELGGVVPTSGFAADPVNTATGNFIEVEEDLVLAGPARSLTLRRTYNSFDQVGGVFGPGWTSPLDVRLDVLEDAVHLVSADGRRSVFPGRTSALPNRARGENLWLARESDGSVASGDLGDDDLLVVRDNAGSWWAFDTEGVWLRSGLGPETTIVGERDEAGRLALLRHPRGRTVALEHDDDGRVRAAASHDGRRVVYGYDDLRRLVSVTASAGARSYTWDPSGRIERVTAADGVVECVNTYDGLGRVTSQRIPSGRLVRFAYLPGRVTSVSDEDGSRADTWMADRRGRVVGIIDSDGRRQSMRYDTHGNLVSSTTRDGCTSVHAYDGRGRLVRSVEADGTDTVVRYDAEDRPVEVERGDRTVAYTYPPGGARGPLSIGTGAGRPYLLTWEEDLLVRAEDPEGVSVEYEYDALGDLLLVRDPLGHETVMRRDEAGRIVEFVTPLGFRTRLTYDGAGHLVRQETPDGEAWLFERGPGGRLDAVVDPLGVRTVKEYDGSGALAATVDGLARTTRFEYDELGNVKGVELPDGARWGLLHDALSRLRDVTDPAGGRWHREHDVVGRERRRTDPTGVVTDARDARPDADAAADGAGRAVRLELDRAGRVAAVRSPSGDRGTVEHDRCGRPVTWTAPDGGRTTLRYDADSRVTAVVDPTGTVTTFEHDACGRIVAEHTPGRGTTSYLHDRAGRLVQVEDPVHGRRTMVRDAAGQVTTVTSSTGSVTEYTSDLLGRTTRARIAGTRDVRIEYTALGDVAATVDPLGRRTTSARDAAGRLLAQTGPDGQTTRFDRTADGLLSAVHHGDELTTRITRTADGRVLTVDDRTHADGVPATHRLEFDAVGRLTRRTTDRAGRRATTEWEYDVHGNRTSMTTPDGARTEYLRGSGGLLTALQRADFPGVVFAHDAAGRPTGSRAGAVEQVWRHEDGQVVGYVSGGAETTLQRDARGRVSSEHLPGGETRTYTYDEGSQLLEVRSGATRSSWTYDAAGRITDEDADLGRRSFVHDDAGQLVRLVEHEDPSATTEFEYDARGRRISQVRGDGSVSYEWDTRGRLRSVTREDRRGVRRTSSFWVNALGELAEVDGVELTWDIAAPIPSVVSVGGTPVVAVPGLLGVDGTWEATGWRHARQVSAADPWRPGEVTGSDRLPASIGVTSTGGVVVDDLEFLGARVHDPGSRSFLSPDPLPPAAGAAWAGNTYSFAGNDPVNQSDPTGLKPITDAELAAYAVSRQGITGLTRRLSNNGAFAVDGDLHGSHALSWMLGMALLDPRPGPGVLLGALAPFPIPGIAIGAAAEVYAGSVLTSRQGQLLFGWATGLSPRTLIYGQDDPMTRVVRDEVRDSARHEAVEALKRLGPRALANGTAVSADGLGYSAGSPGLDNANFLRDVGTILTWPLASERDRTLLTLGTYDVEARLVRVNDDGTAVVEYTAENETTLGSFLRLPGLDYEGLNRAAGDHGPMSRVTEELQWQETVEW